MSKVITLGSQATDRITGIKGTVVARTEWLNGCVRICIQQKGADKDGKAFSAHTADEQDCDVTKEEKPESSRAGGPRPNPERAADVGRF